MKILADYHTHSRYSKWYHARHSVMQMAKYAQEIGLQEIAITDHGPKHFLFGIKHSQIEKAKKDVENANKQLAINVYFGVESNLIGADGSIDLSDQEIAKLDILLMGYHKGTKCDFIKYFGNKKRESKEQIAKNTLAYINAINRYPIDIITHLNEYIKVDTKAVADAAAKRGTIIELNRKHLKFNKQDIKALLDSEVKLIISSDAHKKENIANVDRCYQFILDNNIPQDRVVNLDGLISLKSLQKKSN